jgi:hypothetical protein
VRRSGIRWLREDGATVRPGEAVAFCNIGLAAELAAGPIRGPFVEEWLDVQAVLSTRVGGTLRYGERASRGGFMDLLDHFMLWAPEFDRPGRTGRASGLARTARPGLAGHHRSAAACGPH